MKKMINSSPVKDLTLLDNIEGFDDKRLVLTELLRQNKELASRALEDVQKGDMIWQKEWRRFNFFHSSLFAKFFIF